MLVWTRVRIPPAPQKTTEFLDFGGFILGYNYGKTLKCPIVGLFL
ncbi:hypothetical protein M949_1345 [Riemerella anatipestifer CH3]|nr:hypothetical protein M949_1345 [Riemerella anatipestifer CH3]